MGMIRAGRLDRRVTILRTQAAADDGWQTVPGAFVSIGRRNASLRPVRGNERFEDLRRDARSVMSLWLRSDSLTRTITAKDAILADGVKYALVAPPVEVGRREGVELFLVEDAEIGIAA